MNNLISILNLLLTAGLLLAALAALGTWRVQVLGSREVQLAEECLYSAQEFTAQIKLLRFVSPNNTETEKNIDDLRKTLWQFQRSFLIINYYLDSPINNEIPEAFIALFASIDTNFRILNQHNFQTPMLADPGASLISAGSASTVRQHYECAYKLFYGKDPNAPVEAAYSQRSSELREVLRPILTPDRGWLGCMMDAVASAVQKS